MQLEEFQAFVRIYVERIFQETGAARMQQVGLFVTIFALQNTGEPVTAMRIARLSGQSHSQVHRNLQKLLKLDLVERTKIKNRIGKGQAWHLSIKDTPASAKLLKAIVGGKKSRER
jgi:Fic family protein